MRSRDYFNPERPFTLDEFRNPQLAVKRYGMEEALYRYKEFVEPKYTGDGLPISERLGMAQVLHILAGQSPLSALSS